jgi:hypothetical protein
MAVIGEADLIDSIADALPAVNHSPDFIRAPLPVGLGGRVVCRPSFADMPVIVAVDGKGNPVHQTGPARRPRAATPG